MTTNDYIRALGEVIRRELTPRIPGDYVLLDCPYHANIGDTLIWQGELSLLTGLPGKCLGYGSLSTWLFPRLDPSVTILLHGGGNFGDLWEGVQEFRLRVIETYPENPILVFPQTVHYRDEARMRSDAARMARHRNLTICARDERSFGLLSQHFLNTPLLLPDMAFCIDFGFMQFVATQLHPKKRPLWLQRTDLEKAGADRPAGVPAEAVRRDWPTMERTTATTWLVYKLSGLCDRLGRSGRLKTWRRMAAALANNLAKDYLSPQSTQRGIRFLCAYRDIYTTRLHGAILALLLGKEHITLIDNSYGKNSAFYNAWFRDIPTIHLLGENDGKD